MAYPVTMPRLGWAMEKGTIVEWYKKEGDEVRPGEPLLSVESDKAVQDVEALEGGVLRFPADAPAEGDEVAVGVVLAYLAEPGEPLPQADSRSGASDDSSETDTPLTGAARRQQQTIEPPSATEAQDTAPRSEADSSEAGPARQRRRHVSISPRARQTAERLGLDWSRVRGTGHAGRIRERDVRRLADGRTTAAERSGEVVVRPSSVVIGATADATQLLDSFRRLVREAGEEQSAVPAYRDLMVRIVAAVMLSCSEFDASGRSSPDYGFKPPRSPASTTSHGVDVGLLYRAAAGYAIATIEDAASRTAREIAARFDVLRESNDRTRQEMMPAREPEEERRRAARAILLLIGDGEETWVHPPLVRPWAATVGIGTPSLIETKATVSVSIGFDSDRTLAGNPGAFLGAMVRFIETPALCLAF